MKKFKRKVILLVVFAIAIIISYSPSNEDINIITDFQIHYLDVGQADSSVVFLPDGKTMLIDGGNQDDGRFISSYIRKNGRNNIDYLIATHPHEDHIGGLQNIVENFDIADIYMPRVSYNSTIYYDKSRIIGGVVTICASISVSSGNHHVKENAVANVPNNGTSSIGYILPCIYRNNGNGNEEPGYAIIDTNGDLKPYYTKTEFNEIRINASYSSKI